MPDVTWEVRTKSNGTIHPSAVRGQWHHLTRGQTTRFHFWFEADPDTETAYGSDTYGNGPYESQIDASKYDQYLELEQYLDWADAATYTTDIDNIPTYRERIPPRADIDSLVLGIVPSADLDDMGATGVWGLVVGGRDRRNPTLTDWVMELEVWVLAEYRDYINHTDLENDLSA